MEPIRYDGPILMSGAPLHLADGIYIDNDDDIFYIKDGDFHREDGPAVIGKNGYHNYQAYYINGERHRIDGPAVTYHDGSVEWWANGKAFWDIDDWAKHIGIFDTDEFVLMKLEYG